MESITPFITLFLFLVQWAGIVLVVRHVYERWRVLDLATRATPHATPAQAVQMAQLAGANNLVELEGLVRVLLAAQSRKVWDR